MRPNLLVSDISLTKPAEIPGGYKKGAEVYATQKYSGGVQPGSRGIVAGLCHRADPSSGPDPKKHSISTAVLVNFGKLSTRVANRQAGMLRVTTLTKLTPFDPTPPSRQRAEPLYASHHAL